MFDAMPPAAAATAVTPYPHARQNGLDHLLDGPVTMFASDEEIYGEGEASGTLYKVSFGAVRVYRLLADGRRQICAFHMPGEVFGFESGTERHFFADAICATGLIALRSASRADLSQDLFKLALKSLGRAHDHLLTVGRSDASGRVAAFLIEMAEAGSGREENVIQLPMSRADIADYLGLTIETVSRVLTKMKEARIIRMVTSRQLQVLHWAALDGLTA